MEFKLLKNIFTVFVLAVVLSMAGISKSVADDNGAFRLMVFGDSLSAGYKLPAQDGFVPQLQAALDADGLDNVKVINASVSGNTVSDGLARIDEALAMEPHAVIVELGANDVLNGSDLDVTEQNLAKIISTFQENDVPVMLIGVQIPTIARLQDRNRLNKIYNDLAQKYELPLYPHFLQDVLIERFGQYDLKYMQDDGVHPKAEGVKVMVKKTYPMIKKFLMNM